MKHKESAQFSPSEIYKSNEKSEKRKRPPPPITLPAAKIYAQIVPFDRFSKENVETRGTELADRTNCKTVTNNNDKRKTVDESRAFENETSDVDESDDDESEEKLQKKEKGCRCGRTKCLKQYCACFRTDQRCTSDCVCQDCRNDGKHEAERMMAVRHVRMHSNTAFKGTRLAANDQQVITPRGSVRILRGCRCKKSRCQKKYCECFGVGLSCTSSCVCIDCINGNDSTQDFAAESSTVVAKPTKLSKNTTASPDDSVESAESSNNSPQESDSASPNDSDKAADRKASGDGVQDDESGAIELNDEAEDVCNEDEDAGAPASASAGASNAFERTVNEDEGEEEDEGFGLTPRAVTTPGAHRKGTPMQSRTGWEIDDGTETAAAAFDAQLVLGPPAFSPKSRLRWSAFGDILACSPRSPVAQLQRETSGGAFRQCRAQPCSPMGDTGLPWDTVFPGGQISSD